MSLQIWLPLIKDLKNYGLSGLTFSNTSTSNTTLSSGVSKIGQNSYSNNSHGGGGIVSNKPINLGNKLSMFCWINFTDLYSGSNLTSVGGQHRYPTCTGMGITIKYISATTGYISLNTGDGSNRTYNTYTGSTLLSAGNWYHVGFTYDGSTIKLYVNGKLDGTYSYTNQKNIEDYIQVFCWSFSDSNTSNPAIYSNYCFEGYLNDFRIYDHCLSNKEIKLLSQGLIAHYALKDKDLESTTNVLTYPFKTGNFTASWNTNLHQEAISVQGWSAGYNGGVSNPEKGYHAYWKIIDGLSTVIMPNLNSEFSIAGRWLGVNSNGIQGSVGPNTTYTISFDAKGSVDNMLVRAGYYYRLTSASSNDFHDGYLNARISKQWRRYSATFTTKSTLNPSINSSIYIYGHHDKNVEGIIYVRNIQVEVKNHATGYTADSRIAEKVYDSSGYNNNGDIINDLEINYDSKRYEICTKFNGSSAISCGRGPMVRDAITVSCWGYMDNWSDYTNRRMISCTEGGGWNLEPSGEDSSKGMCFALGSGVSSNNYLAAVSSTLCKNLSSGWHMFTGTYDGYTARIYIDGKFQGQSSTLSSKTPIYYNSSNGIFIGAEAGSSATTPGGQYFNGKISDVRIYATALSEEDILNLYQVPHSINKTGKIFSHEFFESVIDSAKMKESGILECGNIAEINYINDMEIKTLEDGSAWARVFYHKNNGASILWKSYEEVMSCNTQYKYSRLGLLPYFKGSDGKLELMLTFPISFPGKYNRWKQNNPPYRDWMGTADSNAVAPGYEAIHIDFNTNYWGGLTRQNEDTTSISPCLISGSVGHGNWFFAIGASEGWSGTVPGPNSSGADDVEIWVRINSLSKLNTASVVSNKYIQSSEIQEI